MKMTVADLLIGYLKEAGVRHIFGVNGHSVFDVMDAIAREPDVRFVPAQNEQSAGYMAAAYARATKGLGVCLAIEGPGSTNLLSGVASAHKESCPVLAICSEVDTASLHKGASTWHGLPQEDIYRPITKMSATIRRPEETLNLVGKAVREATTGRMGPVFLGVPVDMQTAETEVPPPPWSADGTDSDGASSVDPAAVERALRVLLEAKAPTVILGGGVRWAGCTEEAVEIAELLRAPFGTTPSHKGMASEDHPHALGVLGFGGRPFANRVCRESDVILALGTTFSEALTLNFGDQVVPKGARIVQVDLDPSEIGKSYPVEVGVVGDVGVFLRALLERLRKAAAADPGRSNRLDQVRTEKARYQEEVAERGTTPDGPITHVHVYHTLSEVLPPDTLVVGEGGTGQLLHYYTARSEVYTGGDFRPIGHGVATSVGLGFAFPGRPIVCVSGDGAFMMELEELATAVRERLNVAFLVVHNNAYASMKRDQIRDYDGRVIGTDLLIPDLVTLGMSFGAYVERVERPADLAGAISRALASDGPALLDVVAPVNF